MSNVLGGKVNFFHANEITRLSRRWCWSLCLRLQRIPNLTFDLNSETSSTYQFCFCTCAYLGGHQHPLSASSITHLPTTNIFN
jgi:hypothetical protein